MGHGSRNNVGVLLAVPEVHGATVFRLVEHVLPPFREAQVILDVLEGLTSDSAGIYEDTGLGEHAVEVFKRLYPLANELAA